MEVLQAEKYRLADTFVAYPKTDFSMIINRQIPAMATKTNRASVLETILIFYLRLTYMQSPHEFTGWILMITDEYIEILHKLLQLRGKRVQTRRGKAFSFLSLFE